MCVTSGGVVAASTRLVDSMCLLQKCATTDAVVAVYLSMEAIVIVLFFFWRASIIVLPFSSLVNT